MLVGKSYVQSIEIGFEVFHLASANNGKDIRHLLHNVRDGN
jgi:hypothetical protein